MTDGNNRKENTLKKKDTLETELSEEREIIEEKEEKKEGKNKKENSKTNEKKSKGKDSKPQNTKGKQESDGRLKRIIGILFISFALFLVIALISYLVSFFSGHHQEYGYQIFSKKIEIENRTGRLGVFFAQTLIKESFGIGSFFFVYLSIVIGLRLTEAIKIKMWILWKWVLFCLAWLPLFFAFIATAAPKCAIFGGAVGLWFNNVLTNYVGNAGVIIITAFLFLVFIVYQFNFTLNYFKQRREKREEERRHQAALIAERQIKDQIEKETEYRNYKAEAESFDPDFIVKDEEEKITDFPPVSAKTIDLPLEITNEEEDKESIPFHSIENQEEDDVLQGLYSPSQNGIDLVIEKTQEEETVDEIERHTIDMPFDPRYELRDYQFPTLDMLNDYGGKKAEIDNEELEVNKNKIVETLGNYGIAIDKIKATIGPTVTLYEIVPAAGVRISKIKNLEDDIALSLAALGIRIIAPIPGKGTIGIEVPNSKPETVAMRSVLSSERFQNSKFALPCAIGKTISNETYVFDLAKMPHILMAGATGQGKSVGLNAIIASLLYCKHPSELKFVMVDPKKVELTLYNRIERHYLAKLPDSEDAIITDVKKVVRTLNSLCIEMDQRYDLLKQAECRNIIEYNEKFKSRRLLPTEGHRFLPYIVLIVDEFADLIMTAGREVESPIARLAQLARAIGIHLIIATQRPSVNIITGSIKANFPARIAFRVISAVDSKTILDQSGANQLIGRGDMLLSTGNDLVRLQCAFIDTPEVEVVTEFIGNQRGYAEPFLLPEVPDEEGEGIDIEEEGERDSLFEDAARIVVQTQQGSTSMIQRKLKLGYNRAGRIIDQLEAAGIVGPFSGSKSREVKVKDEFALEQILRDIYNKDNGI